MSIWQILPGTVDRTFKYDHDDKFFTGGQKRNLGNF